MSNLVVTEYFTLSPFTIASQPCVCNITDLFVYILFDYTWPVRTLMKPQRTSYLIRVVFSSMTELTRAVQQTDRKFNLKRWCFPFDLFGITDSKRSSFFLPSVHELKKKVLRGHKQGNDYCICFSELVPWVNLLSLYFFKSKSENAGSQTLVFFPQWNTWTQLNH